MLKRFQNLVDLYRHRVFSFARAYLKDQQEAEDLAQEILLRLWQNLNQIEPGMEMAWLMRVTANACHDLHRKRKGAYLQTMDPVKEESSPSLQFKDPRPGPQESAETKDLEDRLQAALKKLPEPFRTIVLLRETQELSYDEISEILRLPLGTVKVYLHRGRKMLREEFHEATLPQ